ncbi:protein polyglycylase TTLL10 [Lampris incognitus]|uniref:protein polyglycylase TTLL10 n=1 Tax=Lampris incognitus TaxID=2546036 RepID=UPI0024B4BA9A|nr:protein polyglycylase TTLL10 [Lampris incognitus]
MSSEYWIDRRPRSNPDEKGLEETAGEGMEGSEFVCGNNQPRKTVCREDPEQYGGQDTLSHDQRNSQKVTSEGGLESSQKEETEEFLEEEERKVPDKKSGEQVAESQEGESGVHLPEHCVSVCHLRGLKEHSYHDRDKEWPTGEPRGPGPFYFFGGANGVGIVSGYCESRGWRRIYDKRREDFKLKWCETKLPANYLNFREGEQLLYQIPNNKVLTTKIGLLSSLREYDRVCNKVNNGRGLRKLKMEEFFPETFRMDVNKERRAFFATQQGVGNKEKHIWICKPTGLNQGKGIFLLKTQEDIATLKLKLQEMEESQAKRNIYSRQTQAHIVQWYIQNPLLLQGRKFDVRSYLLIACTAPYMVFFRHGYVRLTCDLYDPTSNNLSIHLTNQYMQKKNPQYKTLKEDTVWSMESFNTYVNDEYQVAKGLPRDWVMGAFAKRMQQIMTQCFFAVKSKLSRRLGLFDLIGCDFMVDMEFKVWLLEMNCNPALHTNCKVLKQVVPSTVVESLDITLEIFSKCRSGRQILPLDHQNEFVLLYAEDSPSASIPPRSRSRTGGVTSKSPSSDYQRATKTAHNPERAKSRPRNSGKKGKTFTVTPSDISLNDLKIARISAHPDAISTDPAQSIKHLHQAHSNQCRHFHIHTPSQHLPQNPSPDS